MVKYQKIEDLFDEIDKICIILYEKLEIDYLEALVKTCEFILYGIEDSKLNEESIKSIEKHLDVFNDEFSQEEIRKALQFGVLKGLRHKRMSNEVMTPDTIGVLISYLVNKIFEYKSIKVIDPLLGTSNLLMTIGTNTNKDIHFTGVEVDPDLVSVARVMSEMLEIELDIIYGNVLDVNVSPVDLVVCDFGGHYESKLYESELTVKGNKYFPYLLIEKYIKLLNDGGFIITVIPNNFFEQEYASDFKEVISKYGYMQGLVTLPNTMFKNEELGKSILVIEKKSELSKQQDFLMASLPSFDDMNEVNKVIKKIDNWFMNKYFGGSINE